MMLLGRERIIERIDAAIAQARLGRGTLVLVRGEPGIGKSALLAEAIDRARANAIVTSGRAWELADAPPYFPVWGCLKSLGVSTTETDEFRLWERVLEALARASETQLVVWAIEDIHAADLLTLDLLTFLAQPVRSMRVLVVATARTNDPRTGDRGQQRLTRMSRDGLDVQLEPLGKSEVATLAETIIGRSLPETVAAELAELTNGNPLFVVECARAFRTAGASTRGVPTLPQNVRLVILERVGLLPETTQRVLEACAVIGRDASAHTAGKMLGMLPAAVIDALGSAVKAGIVSETSPGQFTFTHILVRDAIEDAMKAVDRAKLHDAAFGALEGAGEDIVVERARHALAAMRADASALAVGAAKLLEGRGAFDRAYAMIQRATGVDRLWVARLARAAGRFADARALCESVFAGANGDGKVMADAALELGAELRPAAVDRTLVAMLERADAALDPSTPLSCRVRARLAGALQPAVDPNVPMNAARDAIARARAMGDDALILEVLELAGSALVDFAPVDERLALAKEMKERADKANDRPRALRARSRLVNDLAESTDPSWVDAVDDLLDLASRSGHPRQRWRALLFGSMRAVARGQVDVSNRFIVEVQQLAAITDDPALTLSLPAHHTNVMRLLHRDAEMKYALEMLGPSLDVPHSDLVERSLRIALYSRLEDVERTKRELLELGNPPSLELAGVLAVYVMEARAFVGDVEGCRRARASLAPLIDRDLVSGHVPLTYDGPVARVVGLLDSALGDHASADALLGKSLERMKHLGYAAWVAQLHYDRATAWLRGGRRSDADAEFARAADLAEEIGMPGLALRAREKTSVRTREVKPVSTAFEMRREGETWIVAHGTKTIRMKHSRGIELLAKLVERTGEDIHVLVLGSDEGGGLIDASASPATIDARARDRYRARLEEIEDEVGEAERNADAGRLEKLRVEKDMLESEIARAFGLGGKSRGSGSPSERARVNVQRRLKDAIARIAEVDSEVGRFVEKSLRTGTYCRFGA